MSDLTPPPDEPMPDQVRARIRADLLAAAQADHRSGARRWLVPAVAAAAVLVVAGFAGWAVQTGDSGDNGAPTGGGTSTSESPEESPEASANLEASKVPGTQEDHQVDVKDLGCAKSMSQVLPGAERAVVVDGNTSFWVAGQRFVLCDTTAGITTVQHPLPLEPVERASTYAVSSVAMPWPHSTAVSRVAGGIVPAGAMAFDVTYTFPGGATQRADTVTDDQGRTWWRMWRVYDEGRGNEMDQPPIQVTVSYSGAQHTYELHWGVDTCAQANHGC
jgi:hypothetical protein